MVDLSHCTTMNDSLVNFIHSSPITCVQLGTGATLWACDLLGIIPFKSVLLHPRLAFSPVWQPYRLFTTFLVTGFSLIDILQRSIGSIIWQAPLEALLNGPGDRFQAGKRISKGTQRQSDRGQKSLVEWLVAKNKFLHCQLLSATFILALDLFTFSLSPSKQIIRPYSLYPALEYSMRWLWAFTARSPSIAVFGSLPMKPIYLPIIFGLMGGSSTVKLMVKGFVAALAVSQFMEFKRPDGSTIFEWVVDIGKSWVRWFRMFTSVVERQDSTEFPHVQDFTTTNLSPRALVESHVIIDTVLSNVHQFSEEIANSFASQPAFSPPNE